MKAAFESFPKGGGGPLIKLLVVIAIIAILTAMIHPAPVPGQHHLLAVVPEVDALGLGFALPSAGRSIMTHIHRIPTAAIPSPPQLGRGQSSVGGTELDATQPWNLGTPTPR